MIDWPGRLLRQFEVYGLSCKKEECISTEGRRIFYFTFFVARVYPTGPGKSAGEIDTKMGNSGFTRLAGVFSAKPHNFTRFSEIDMAGQCCFLRTLEDLQ